LGRAWEDGRGEDAGWSVRLKISRMKSEKFRQSPMTYARRVAWAAYCGGDV
jgi:hypothetical protein